MSTEKRLVLFLVLSVASMWGMRFALDQLGLLPPPPKKPAAQAPAEVKPAVDAAKPATDDVKVDESQAPVAKAARSPDPAEPNATDPPAVSPAELHMGSAARDPSNPYLLQLQLEQRGAGVASLVSSRIEAEIVDGQPRTRPLTFIRDDPSAPAQFALEASLHNADGPAGDQPAPSNLKLTERLWEVVPDQHGKLVRAIQREAGPGAATSGQEVLFRARIDEPSPLIITKSYRLWPGEEGFDLEITYDSPSAEQSFTYTLGGPHGIPIEGEWYTATFRDVFFGGVSGQDTKILTLPAYTVAKDLTKPERYTALPIRFAGVENQYFAMFLQPVPAPTSIDDSKIAEGRAIVIHDNPKDKQKDDVSVELISKPISVGPNRPTTHRFRIFAGPKTYAALAPFGATDLSAYRKGWSLPVIHDLGASFMAKRVIAPMLDSIYGFTAKISSTFKGSRGSYGIAIILLTITVRLILFPLGRKQARAAKKMQDLQPLLVGLKEKCGDDKEKLTRETFALYKEHGVNPMGGCLPALVQLPVLIGLWQALNNSVALRHSSFLWIKNLAAPDQLFKFPFDMTNVPLIGWAIGPYFNLLPIVVVGLMLVQTKLFAPPATTPEAEAQQKMMKYMMVFMMFMFYKVPAGLGIYFITSSLWQIGERLLLPKSTPLKLPVPEESGSERRATRSTAALEPPAKSGWIAEIKEKAREKAQRILNDAAKETTVRNGENPADARPARPRTGRKR